MVYGKRARVRGRERERERDRQTDRQTDTGNMHREAPDVWAGAGDARVRVPYRLSDSKNKLFCIMEKCSGETRIGTV